jgi:hypothetical protein
MEIRTYNPEGYTCSVSVQVTNDQAKALDKIWKRNQFDAYFWASKVEYMNDGDVVGNSKVLRIDGVHYVLSPETDGWKGCGGNKHKIRLLSGEEIETTNLWHQGPIPEELKDELPNNAEWVK